MRNAKQFFASAIGLICAKEPSPKIRPALFPTITTKRGTGFLFGFYIEGELASSIRVHIASKEHPDFISLKVFSDFLQPELDAGKVIVDPTRFVTDKTFSRLYRALPYATMRVAGMACEYFGADQLLAAVRTEHQAFYRRAFHHQLICEARPYPGLTKPLSLMMMHYPTLAGQLHQRFPFFRSTSVEQQMLFGRHQRPDSPPAAGQRCTSGQLMC